MENTISLNSHEALELHELIRNKVTELKKTQSSLPMVQDSDLQAYMNDCLETGKDTIRQLQDLVDKSGLQ